MYLDDVAVGIVEEYLIPTGHRPCSVIRIGDFLFFEAALEGLNVVRSKAEVAPIQRIDDVLHAEAEVDIPARQVKFDRSVSHEVDVSPVTIGGIDALIVDRAKVEYRAVKLGQAGHILGTQIHVVEFHIHRLILFALVQDWTRRAVRHRS